MDLGDVWEPGEEVDFPNPTLLGRYFKCLYNNTYAYVSGGPQNNPTSVPARLACIGFGWFLLILMASYTANLASILVVKSTMENVVSSLDDAIKQRLQICIMSPILPEMGAIYPGINFVSTDGAAAVLRAMNKKECDVGILAANDIRRAMSGEFNEDDCKNSKYRDACIKDDSGKPEPTRDCSQWAAIGNPVLIMPLSLPITKSLHPSFTYTIQKMKTEGVLAKFMREETERLDNAKNSACPGDGEGTGSTEDLQLSVAELAGTFIFAVLIQSFALSVSVIEYYTGKPIQACVGLYDHILKATEPHPDTHHITRGEFMEEMKIVKSLLSKDGQEIRAIHEEIHELCPSVPPSNYDKGYVVESILQETDRDTVIHSTSPLVALERSRKWGNLNASLIADVGFDHRAPFVAIGGPMAPGSTAFSTLPSEHQASFQRQIFGFR
jgi:hypothetical protein